MAPRCDRTTSADRPVNRQDPSTWLSPGQSLLDDDGLDWAWAYVWFKDIPGYPEHKVEWHGTVWTSRPIAHPASGLAFNGWTKVATHRNWQGYIRVKLRINGTERLFRMHRLVLTVFMGPSPAGMECCHNDGNPGNNVGSTLRWDTRLANNRDKIRHGNSATTPVLHGSRNPAAKLTESKVREIRRLVASGKTCAELGRQFGVSERTVCSVRLGRSWQHVT